MKDHIPPENKSGIYQINCKDCEKIYIGKTKRYSKIGKEETLISGRKPHVNIWMLN